MYTLDRRTFLLSGLALWSGAAFAVQESPPGQEASLLNQLVPNPTGQNGYEELLAAAGAIRSSKLFRRLQNETDVSLAWKRQLLMDPPVVRSLTLLQRGLAKPVRSPRQEEGWFTDYPEFPPFRSIAWLLLWQEYVYLADGRVPDALASLRLCLRFARAVQEEGSMGSYAGVAIAGVGVSGIAGHLEQLGARDCETLFRLAADELKQPDPLAHALGAERRSARTTLTRARAGDRPTLEHLGRELSYQADFTDDTQKRQEFEEMRALVDSPARLSEVLGQAERRLDAFYDHAQGELKKPAWERTWDVPKPDGSLAARFEQLFSPAGRNATQPFIRRILQLQLLAVHATVLRYRWEHEQVPASLAALELGDLVIDPFTGAPLKYEPQGRRRYRLTSAGWPAGGDDPRAVNGRLPYSIIPGDLLQ
jgi:hypothetical protein